LIDLNRLLKNEHFKLVAAIVVIAGLMLGFFVGLSVALGTAIPLRVVESGSMCIEPSGCNGWSHPFDHTLHVGDIIIIQAVNPQDLNVNYPNSDIIVYQRPTNPADTPIVHRIVASYKENGTLYFQTKGDGNGKHWPAPVDSTEYDSHTIWVSGEGVPQDLILGRVVMRIPYLGWITLLMRGTSWALPLVIVLIVLLIIIEFVFPLIKAKNKKKPIEQQNFMAHVEP
jgi:signal peptidase I